MKKRNKSPRLKIKRFAEVVFEAGNITLRRKIGDIRKYPQGYE